MIIFRKLSDWQYWIDNQATSARPVGFVPTMGALHEGHLSLIRTAVAGNHTTVCSIFVNPTQFNDPADFEKYPVTIEKDLVMLEGAGCDVVLLPGVSEIYPRGLHQLEHYDLGFLEKHWEGKFRPGHFQGVCNVVDRLFELVRPDKVYLGQKDYQQCMVITALTRLKLYQPPIEIVVCPTLREPDGLAMSSRNMRLNMEERRRAPMISAVLEKIKTGLQNKVEPATLLAEGTATLNAAQFRIDYLTIADAVTLEPVLKRKKEQHLVILVAAFLNEVRLIDNMVV